jgi:signal transduction histidine kinase
MRKVMSSLSYRGEINVSASQDMEIDVYSDESKIREILEQLIRNSIKYCTGTRKIWVIIRYNKENLYCKVSDNGVGIPEDELPYIFAPYYRGVCGEANNIDGDGLGLWVAKMYVDMLGGKITARTNYENDAKGKVNGSSFTLIIPRVYSEKKR